MAVEDQITNFMNTHQGNHVLYNTQMGIQCSNTMRESIGVPLFYDTVSEKNMKNSDNGVCYNLPSTMSRKRSRDTFNEFDASNNVPLNYGNSSFFGEKIVRRSEVQQSEIDRIISQQTQRLKMELEQQMQRQAKMLLSAVHGSVTQKLKEKDEEIEKTVKANWILQETVKKLFLENQLWKQLAHNNEATINTLQNNLVQVMAHVSNKRLSCADDVADDAESCCQSNDDIVGEEEVVTYEV